MSLLVLITAFLVEMFWQKLPEYRHHRWVNEYHDRWILQINGERLENEWVRIAAIMMPPVIVAGILIWSEQEGLGLLFQWVISVVIVLWSLGPVSIADKAIQLHASDTNNDEQLRELMIYGHRNYFAIVFWFMLAGPVAALSYRLIHQFMLHQGDRAREGTVEGDNGGDDSVEEDNDEQDSTIEDHTKEDETQRKVTAAWRQLFAIADFIPARVTGFLFLLTGDFLRGFGVFKNYLTDLNSDTLVTETGCRTIQDCHSEEALGWSKELLERSFILLLVMVAVISVFSA